MQIYCGTDIIEVSRIEDAVKNTKGFKENIYTKNEIENIDKSSIPYSWFQSHGILIQEGLYPRLAYLKAVDELYFKEDK